MFLFQFGPNVADGDDHKLLSKANWGPKSADVAITINFVLSKANIWPALFDWAWFLTVVGIFVLMDCHKNALQAFNDQISRDNCIVPLQANSGQFTHKLPRRRC